MSSVLSEYPGTLPAPMVGVATPTERRKVGSIGGVQSFRTVQRDRHGTRTYAFTFTKEQAAIFRDWWAEWEQRGGGWFAANWPLPWSRGPNVFRFKNPPEWSMIGGGIDGQGYWRVSGSVEIRGRGMLPTVEVMYLTSTPYPIVSIDSIGVNANRVWESPSIQDYMDGMSFSAGIISIDARDIYQQYSMQPEALSLSASILSIYSETTSYRTYSIKPEGLSVSSGVLEITASEVLIVYRNNRPEGISLAANITSIASTGT